MSAVYHITYNVTDFENALGELIKKLEHREPLMRELAAAMGDAVEENFKNQGRPEWMGWKSNAYWAKRRGGKILQRSGRLASSISQQSSNDEALVGTNVVYARIHQEGGSINIPARSQRAYYHQRKDGSLNNRFARKSKANYSEWNTIPGYQIKMPARPFLHLTESDVDGMEETAKTYLQRVIDS